MSTYPFNGIVYKYIFFNEQASNALALKNVHNMLL